YIVAASGANFETILSCPSVTVTSTNFTRSTSLNYGKVHAYVNANGTGGSMRLDSLASYVFVAGEADGYGGGPISGGWTIYSPARWGLNLDTDGDGIKDTNSGFVNTNNNFYCNGFVFNHSRQNPRSPVNNNRQLSDQGTASFADGSASAVTRLQWVKTSTNMWGPWP
ncbi:MAG: hypothetical protein WCS99_21345, partial [Limisphaerales bacterium]